MLKNGWSRWSWAAVAAVMVVAVGCDDDDNGNNGNNGNNNTNAITRRATLSGANEVPLVVTPASGTVTATLTGTRLSVAGSFSGLGSDLFDVGGSPAHVHQGAAGQNGPVIIPLQVAPGADRRSGSLAFNGELTADQAQAFRDGLLYVNVHTQDHQSGEIRAQLGAEQPLDTTFDVTLSGANEVPPVTTTATGTTRVRLIRNLLVVTGSVEGLSSDLHPVAGSPAHVHQAPAGENGPIAFNLVVVPGTDNRSATFVLAEELTEDDVARLTAGLFYVNVHTTTNPEGELRGQLVSTDPNAPKTTIQSRLAGANEVPAATTDAAGTATATLAGRRLTLEGTFQGLGSDLFDVGGSPAHVHSALIGENGPIAFNLEVTPGADRRSGTFRLQQDLTDAEIETLFDGGFYVNVHSVTQPTGEIRGQLLLKPLEPVTALVTLSGDAEVPPVQTTATGASTAKLDGFALAVSGQFTGLQSNLETVSGSSAHVHDAPAGQNGPILFNLQVTPGADQRSGTFTGSATLDDAQWAAFRNGELYVNVHTTGSPGGEIRAQLEPIGPIPSVQ